MKQARQAKKDAADWVRLENRIYDRMDNSKGYEQLFQDAYAALKAVDAAKRSKLVRVPRTIPTGLVVAVGLLILVRELGQDKQVKDAVVEKATEVKDTVVEKLDDIKVEGTPLYHPTDEES